MTQDPTPPDYSSPPSNLQYPGEQPPPQVVKRPVLISTPQVKPIITYTLLAVSVVIFIFQYGSAYLFGYDLVAGVGMKVNELILEGQYWRLFTPMFLHGSILHLGFNMYALFIFGPGLERYYGHWRFILLFILSGFAGNVFSFMFSDSPSLGSSTAIFGLLAAEGVFLYQNQKVLGGSARRALNNLVIIAVVNLIIGLSPGIDNWGHLGGLLGGGIFAFLGGPVLEVQGLAPDLRLINSRESSDVIRAVLIDGLIFVALAAGTIYLRSV